MSTRGAGSADRHFTAPHRGDLRVPRRRPVAALERGVPVRSDGIEVSVGVTDIDGPVHDHRGCRDRSACIKAVSFLPKGTEDTELSICTSDEDAVERGGDPHDRRSVVQG